MTNLPARHTTLQQEITALTESLSPPAPDFIATALNALKRGGMLMPKGIAPEDFIKEYTLALSSVPRSGLMTAVAKLKSGQYEIDHAFLPRPAELAAMARLEAKSDRDDLIRKRAMAEALAPSQKLPDRSPEVMARVKSKLAAFRAETEARKAKDGGLVLHEPITPERAEYLSQIMALKIDAPNLTAEQLAYRRKAERDINEVAGSAKEAAE